MSGTGKISEDLTGQVFGRLTVIERAGNVNGRTAWLCQCSCGNKKVVIGRYLKSGKAQSCGCLRKEKQEEKARDITGYRFGRLKALHPTDKRDANGSVIWVCQCDCGNTAEVSIAGLMAGNNISCGCAKDEAQEKIKKQTDFSEGTSINILSRRNTRQDNTSGFRGISKTKDGRYRVSIGFKGKRYYIGIYANYSDAVRKRIDAEQLIYHGYIRAKEFWSRKEPLIYDVVKKNGKIIISSNDRHENGNFMICRLTDSKPQRESLYQETKQSSDMVGGSSNVGPNPVLFLPDQHSEKNPRKKN